MAFLTSPTNLIASSKASAFHGSTCGQSVHQARRTASAVRMMQEQSIDFGKIDVRTAGENLQGLVFVPETERADIETRVNIGYTAAQEAAINNQVNVEYTASYAYHALWSYFDRDTVALPGFAKYFKEQSDEEREHAEDFMRYQNKRGGKVELQPLAVPEMSFTQDDGASDATYAMDLALQLEKFVYMKLLDLHKVAENADDPQMQDYVESHLDHQVEAVKTAADYVARLKRVATPHGIYHIDLEFRGEEEGAAAMNGAA